MKSFEEFSSFVRRFAAEGVSQQRIETQFESLKDWSLFHSLDAVKSWFCERRTACSMVVEEIPLNAMRGWTTDVATGTIAHTSGEFFYVGGVRVSDSRSREVGGWDQPICVQVGYDGGILGLLRTRFDGIPHYLIEAKAEPGNYEKLQLSPTLQATFSNLRRAHGGRKPHFAEWFEQPEAQGATVLYKAWLAEDGGRLHLKRNLGMLVEAPATASFTLPDGFIWMSLFQVKACLLMDAWVNPHVRGIIAHL